MGRESFYKGLLRYYNEWKFQHPNVNDFVRVMEKTSGLELDWFKEYWVHTTHTMDYAVDTMIADGNNTVVELRRVGIFPMPQEVTVTYKDGNTELYYLPLRVMRGEKDFGDKSVTTLADWPWTHSRRAIIIDRPMSDISEVRVGADLDFADVDRVNNVWPREEVIEDVDED